MRTERLLIVFQMKVVQWFERGEISVKGASRKCGSDLMIDLAEKNTYSDTNKLQPRAIDRFREERNDSFYLMINRDKQLSQLPDPKQSIGTE